MVRQSQVGEPEMQNVTIPSVDRERVIQESADSTRAREMTGDSPRQDSIIQMSMQAHEHSFRCIF